MMLREFEQAVRTFTDCLIALEGVQATEGFSREPGGFKQLSSL